MPAGNIDQLTAHAFVEAVRKWLDWNIADEPEPILFIGTQCFSVTNVIRQCQGISTPIDPPWLHRVNRDFGTAWSAPIECATIARFLVVIIETMNRDPEARR